MAVKFGQVMLDVAGTELSAEDRELIAHPQVGGLILFTRNYNNRAQLKALTSAIKAIKPEIIIAVDQEGGRVQRFVEGFTVLPSLGTLGEVYVSDPERAFDLARLHAHTLVTELQSVGIDISFTPVLDRNIGVSEVIGLRSFAEDAEVIVALARVYIEQMHEDGMPVTGKHYPGHGAVEADSHYTLPIDARDYETIADTDLLPFVQLAQELDAVMAAHVCYPAVSEMPAGFDTFWLQTVLRERLGFNGVIFSDCLTMSATAAYGSYADRADLSFHAGCDMVLVCNNRHGAIEVLQAHGDRTDPVAAQRLMNFLRIDTKVRI